LASALSESGGGGQNITIYVLYGVSTAISLVGNSVCRGGGVMEGE